MAIQQRRTKRFLAFGGVHNLSNTALFLETQRYKHPNHWVPISLLPSQIKHIALITKRRDDKKKNSLIEKLLNERTSNQPFKIKNLTANEENNKD